MATNYIITEWFGDKRIQKFVVSQPSVGEPNFYRNGISIESFRNRESKRCFGPKANPKHRKGRRFSMQPEGEYELDIARALNSVYRDLYEDQIKEWQNMPSTNVSSIWDFYKQINYDYKKRKFL